MVQHLTITNTNRNYLYYKLKNINKQQLTLGVLLGIKILRNTHDAPKPRNHISLKKITHETTQLNCVLSSFAQVLEICGYIKNSTSIDRLRKRLLIKMIIVDKKRKKKVATISTPD
jgi:hypothetical protein